MKKINFWLFYIVVSVPIIITSCSKTEEKTTATTSSSTAACSTSLSSTASGTLTDFATTKGVDNVTGTYSMSWQGATPSGGCITSGAVSTMISYDGIPSDSQNFKLQYIITSDTSFTRIMTYYSDNNSCDTVSGYHADSYTGLTVGDNITIASAPSPYPDYATKVSYKHECFMGKGVTDTATAFLNSMSTVSGAVTGTELNQAGDGETYYNIMALNDNLTSTSYNWFYLGPKSTSAYPDNFSSSSCDVNFQSQ